MLMRLHVHGGTNFFIYTILLHKQEYEIGIINTNILNSHKLCTCLP